MTFFQPGGSCSAFLVPKIINGGCDARMAVMVPACSAGVVNALTALTATVMRDATDGIFPVSFRWCFPCFRGMRVVSRTFQIGSSSSVQPTNRSKAKKSMLGGVAAGGGRTARFGGGCCAKRTRYRGNGNGLKVLIMAMIFVGVAALTPLSLSAAKLRSDHTALRGPHRSHTAPESPKYQTQYYDQRLDHFKPDPTMWRQRYLINDEHWGGPGSPILFYTGNEGPVDAFWGACGFITDVLAPRLKGLLIFAEERFYGGSLPFGPNASFTPGALAYLSTEQVLADYASLLTALKRSLNATTSKVVAFGGSYGGTLSTIFRVKYPHVVVGALAASAPLGYYSPSYWAERGVDAHTWFNTVVRDYTEARPGCYSALVRAVGLANASARSTDPAKSAALAKSFGLCSPPTDAAAFVYWITEVLESIPQIDYPYAVGTLPASPVNATCASVRSGLSDAELLAALAAVTTNFYGVGADARAADGCIPEALARSNQAGGGTPGDGPAPRESWGYQSCTETLHAFSVPPGSWRSYAFSLPAQTALCERYYNVTPRMHWLETWAGGYAISDKLSGHSNIIWSNGKRDPWHGGGFLLPSDALPGGAVFVMEHTAHHQDLRAPHAADPPELVRVREEEEKIIRGWLA